MEGRPWLFEGTLFSVVDFDGCHSLDELDFDHALFWVRMYKLPLACMGREVGQKLGSIVGVVEEVDTNEDEIGWGEYLHVRIHVNVTKPLSRGRMLKLKDKSKWIPFQYEKIPKFCF